MNIKTFKGRSKSIVFCFVDNTHIYSSAWTKEVIKNQSDLSITNVTSKGYSVVQGQDENALLRHVATDYEYAVVFSTGTEFINGSSFFEELDNLIKTDFFIAGHILDRGDAYYELHHQCYVVNLNNYKEYNFPEIGNQELGKAHSETVPIRSKENYHDNYTPTWVCHGDTLNSYNHKCHGWNVISEAFKRKRPVLVFSNSIRNSKKHFYPENQVEFLKHSTWLYARHNYCATDFVHTSNTDWSNSQLTNIQQVFTPASGTWWVEHIDTVNFVKVVMYDYNQKALDYWKDNAPQLPNVHYEFVKLNLLTDTIDLSTFDPKLSTLINLSNIFAYEATAPFYSLEYRLHKENAAITAIKQTLPNAVISFSARACTGFVDAPLVNDIQPIEPRHLNKPTWHNEDWLL
jgi:hypothetical protein